MSVFCWEFPWDIIPHIRENGDICDNIHNYRRPKASEAVAKKETQMAGGTTAMPGGTTAMPTKAGTAAAVTQQT